MRLEKDSEQASKMYLAGSVFLIVFLVISSIIYNIKYRNPNAEKKAELTLTNTKEPENFLADDFSTVWEAIEPVTQDSHVLGNPNASLTLIVYLDIEGSFCKEYYKTTKNILETYGSDGTLRLIFRHLPNEHQHPTAPKEAEASECVAEIGGNSKFWQYLDILIEGQTPSKNNLTEELAKKASSIDINKEAFKICLDSNKYEKLIAQNILEAKKIGASGAPFSVLIDSKGKILPIPGMLSYQRLEDIIKAMKRSSGIF